MVCLTVFKVRCEYERAVASDRANARFVWPSQTLGTFQNPQPSGSEAAVLTANKSDGYFSNDARGDAVSALPGGFRVSRSQRPGPDGCRTHTASGGGVLMAPVLQVVVQPGRQASTRRITRTTFT